MVLMIALRIALDCLGAVVMFEVVRCRAGGDKEMDAWICRGDSFSLSSMSDPDAAK